LPASLLNRALVAAALSACVATLLLLLGPPGRDLAAHAYQRELFLEHGFALWNNLWYAGRYSFVTYSVLYYPLAAAVGIAPLAVASIAAATYAFALVAGREWGESARWPTFAFAVVWTFTVFSAAYPFALGFALALLALSALQVHRTWRFAVLAAFALAASPLAFVFLTLVLLAVAAARRTTTRGLLVPALAVVAIVAVELLLRRLFADSGRFPFPTREFVAIVLFCIVGAALTARVARARTLHTLFIVYLAACAVVFAVPSSIGENIARLRFAAIPLALLTITLRQWRPLLVSVPVLLLAVSYNLTPLAASVVVGSNDPTAERAFWQPVVAFLREHSTPAYRVEVVDTKGHWGAAYLPRAGIPLARGWYRQDDFPQNRILYRRYDSGDYLRWLRRLAVRYVVLTPGPHDYSARREATLLRSERSGLRVAWRTPTVTIYAVPKPRPLAVGPHPAAVVALTPTRARLRVAGPGTYDVAIRSSPYWQASRGCLTASDGGMLRLTVQRAGAVELRFAVTRRALVETLVGEHETCAD
jgi:hypothetical protein